MEELLCIAHFFPFSRNNYVQVIVKLIKFFAAGID